MTGCNRYRGSDERAPASLPSNAMTDFRIVAALFIVLVLHGRSFATETERSIHSDKTDTQEEIRFHVPFDVINHEGLDLESVSLSPPDLRIKRKLRVNGDSSSCSADNQTLPSYPSIQAGDRLVAVDGVPISLQTFNEVIDSPVGSVMILPLFKSSAGNIDGNILTGFARVEIIRPESVHFQPTTAERVAEILEWQTALALRKQLEQKHEQEESERVASVENDKLEAEARERQEKDELYRLEMTPHANVPAKRRDDREFRYEVIFNTKGPIGLNWDLLVEDKTVVSYVEPKLAAERVGIIAPKDQLIFLNDVDTSTFGPTQVVQLYAESTPPRRMVFRCGGLHSTAPVSALEVKEKIQNWTIVFDSPSILSGWRTRLHLATWSLEPVSLLNKSLTVASASPITGCLPLVRPTQVDSILTYRGGCSFVEKAQNSINSNAKALLVVNNVKDHGRFPTKMPNVANIDIPVLMIGKLEGELVMAILEYEAEVRFRIHEEDTSDVRLFPPVAPPPKLSNAEMVFRRDPKKAARPLTFWFINGTSQSYATAQFSVLPALFGGKIATTPYRIVMAYPQETACHPLGLGVLATRSVLLVKRGGCSFGAKAKSVQAVGGIGMIMMNSDETLLPLMSDPKEAADVTIWAASISISNGTFIEDLLAYNKNLPSLVKVDEATAEKVAI